MELIYLWVEDYKNIKKQGFNFSLRFECSYEDGILDITEKTDYLENFFGKNINITAIVGENGSGKSNILESLLSIIYKNDIPWDNYKLSAIFYDEEEKKYFEKSINCSISIVNNIIDSRRKKIKTFAFHYNYSLDYIKNKEHNINFNKFYHKTDNYKTPILLQPNKANNSINIRTMDYLANQDILNFIIHKKVSFRNINHFFEATQCKLDFHYSYIYGTEDHEKNNSLFLYMRQLSLDKELLIFDDVSTYGIEDYSPRLEYITRDGLILLTKFYIIKKAMKNKKIILHKELKKCIEEENYTKALHIISNTMFKRLFGYDHMGGNQDIYVYQTNKIRQSFSFIEFLKLQGKEYKLSDKIINVIENKDLLLNLAPWVSIEFFNEQNISFYDLSYGQRFLIKFLYSLLNQINNLSVHYEYQNIILMLDEVEMGLHPQWQKEFIALILNVLKKRTSRFNFQIIITSHSPFIISDLPKKNVIFLEKYTQKEIDKNSLKQKVGNCKNSTENININPFGANIHTLLSHGFFMQDGLMGEFAKGKINNVVKLLKSKRKLSKENQKVCKNIISIIGEPILKSTLETMLADKLSPNETKLEKLKRQQKEIKEAIQKEEQKGESNENS